MSIVSSRTKNFGTLLKNNPRVAEISTKFTVSNPTILYKGLVAPNEFDGRKVWDGYLSDIQNQGTCGGCYAFASVGSLADRFAIQTNNETRVKLSSADMIICMLTDPKLNIQYILHQDISAFEDKLKEDGLFHP